MIIINIILLWLIAGCCNGVMDAIKFHDAYAQFGSFWSKDAWKFYYDDKKNWFEKILKAPFDAWHLLKYIMILAIAISVLLAFLFNVTLIMGCIIVFLCLVAFVIGFDIAYI